MEIKTSPSYGHFDADLPPVLVVETTISGWRGLTLDGVVLNVETKTGIPFGGRVAVTRKGEHVGYRAVPDHATPGLIDRYLRCYDMARKAVMNERLPNALLSIETAISFVPTLAAQYNRGMILLEMGKWQEGLAEYIGALEYPGSVFARPNYRACIEYGMRRWHGEDIRDKKLLLIHDHGFGDSIMMLRYVPMLKAMGAEVELWVPRELQRLAVQHAPVVSDVSEAHYFCPLLTLLQVLQQTPDAIIPISYLAVDQVLLTKWHNTIDRDRYNVGVAWSPGVTNSDDYPRGISLAQLRRTFSPDIRVVSVQQNNHEDAEALDVACFDFEDFADCAAAMMACDSIVTIDTAAVHLAGAIGHPVTKLLLSHWASWRWQARLYPNLQICRQDVAGDWNSALAKL